MAYVFSGDFSLGTNLSVAPAAGGDGEDGDTVGGPDDGGDFLGNFWGDLIELAPEEDADADAATEDATADELFGDDDQDLFDDDEDIFGDDDEEGDLVFDDE